MSAAPWRMNGLPVESTPPRERGRLAVSYLTAGPPTPAMRWMLLLTAILLASSASAHEFCADEAGCAAGLEDIALGQGADAALGELSELMARGTVQGDGHDVAHRIGRAVARSTDGSAEGFLSCPQSFNYGCQHGFFEEALLRAETPGEAAASICEPLKAGVPKDYFYCYHGAGHGIMMAVAYRLDDALRECDTLPAPEGCWQGVFMENVNGVMQGISSRGFTEDPLAPCDTLDEKYQWECYINHAGYLVQRFSLADASRACLQAEGRGRSACAQSLGLMTTSPGWQERLLGRAADLVEGAHLLCGRFPDESRADCEIGAVDNLLNFAQFSDAPRFCGAAESTSCYARITSSISLMGIAGRQLDELCAGLPEEHRFGCPRRSLFSRLKALLLRIAVRFRNAPSAEKTAMPREDAAILSDDSAVREALGKHTLPSIMAALSTTGDCHTRAHQLGRLAYTELGTQAFKECGPECHSGCHHGAIEAFFAEKGTASLAQDLALLCGSEPNGFASHQCLHGVGHGLAAWTNYDIPEALGSCDLLSGPARESCYTGVFMENIVGGLAGSEHRSSYLSDDPHYPCNAVDWKYRSACYFLQTSRMMVLFSADFDRIASACAESGAFQQHCFESMGRDLSGFMQRDPQRIIPVCLNASGAQHCLTGAIQDQFWDASQQDRALRFCAFLDGAFQTSCYQLIITRAPDVLQPRETAEFCAKLPKEWRAACDNAAPSGAYQVEAAVSEERELSATRIIRFNGTFSPEELVIAPGEVTFVNDVEEAFWPASNVHPTHDVLPAFDARRPLPPGATYAFTFPEGEWRFHDHLHPEAGGVIRVSAAPRERPVR